MLMAGARGVTEDRERPGPTEGLLALLMKWRCRG